MKRKTGSAAAEVKRREARGERRGNRQETRGRKARLTEAWWLCSGSRS
jgi:hypothetical protein